MIKIQAFILLVLFLMVNPSFSQTEVGLQYDINGQAIHGYFDPLSYSPEKKLVKTHFANSFAKGHYYDSIGNKVEGLIQFESRMIYFKEKNSSHSIIFTPKRIKSFVIGVDSFFVAQHFYLNEILYKRPEYVQYISEYEGNTFVKHYKFSTGLSFQLTRLQSIKETFMVKEKNKMILDYFPKGRKFKDKALKYFGNVPHIKNKVSSRDFKGDDILSIIKHVDYEEKYKKSESINFDAYWHEIRNSAKAIYHAKIVNRQDSIWTFEYFQDSVKLYSVNYSSFYPNIKNGEFKAYYPNGIVRHSILYKNNKAKEEKTYDKNGTLKIHYKHYKRKNASSKKVLVKTIYISVLDSLGNNILESGIKQKIKVYDEYRKQTYTHIYKNRELVSSFRIMGKDTVYQITSPSYHFNINKIQKSLDYYLADDKYNRALAANAQGIILASIVIDKKGNIVEKKLLSRLHPQINQSILDFLRSNFPLSTFASANFKPFKHNKSKQYCEFVLPIDFNVIRFYRQPVNFNHFNHWNHFHQANWHFQQQQMIKNFTPPPPPTFNRKF